MVFFIAQDGTRPVNLLAQYKPDDLMRENQFGQTPGKAGPGKYRVVNTKSAADEKDQITATLIRFLLNVFGQPRRRHLLAVFIQSNQNGVRGQRLKDFLAFMNFDLSRSSIFRTCGRKEFPFNGVIMRNAFCKVIYCPF